MQKTRPAAAFLVLTLLAGCINLRPARIYDISGIIFHANTEIPVAYAEVAVTAGSRTYPLLSDLQGRFSMSLWTSLPSVAVAVDHPGYLPVQQRVKLGRDQEVSVLIELSPNDEGSSVVTGIIDYALPQIPSAGRQAHFGTGFEPMGAEAWAEEPAEIIVEPYAYSDDIALEIGGAIGAEASQLFPEAGIIVYPKPETLTMEQFLAAAQAHPLVKAADINHPVYPLAVFMVPNDPDYHRQWNLDAVYLPFAWTHVEPRATVRIAVLDTLISTTHPDLQQNLCWQDGYNVVDPDAGVSDDFYDSGRPDYPPFSHATYVTGIIGATANNLRGIAGIVWGADVQIIPIVVLNRQNRSSLSHVIAGIDKAMELGADIINMSFGANMSEPHTHMLYRKIQEAYAAGVIMVAAAGNDGILKYPAGYDEVIAVGATASDHRITYYSAADGVELFAPGGEKTDPGEGIYSTDLEYPSGDGYSPGRGTSIAAPHVTGIAALVKSTYPYISNAELEELLWNTGIVLDPRQPRQRLVNAYAAVTNTPVGDASVIFTNLDTTAEYEVQFDQNRYFHELLPPGLYRITAHIDANRDQTVNPGEWYYESEMLLEPAKHVSDLQIRLDIHR